MNQFKKTTNCFLIFSIAFTLIQCKDKKKENNSDINMEEVVKSTIDKSEYGTTSEGEIVDIYTLTNKNGMEAKIMTLGGIITSLTAPDRDGEYKDIVLGFNTLDEYLNGNPFFGTLVGRYGNRIAKGKFSLDGVEYTLATNGGANHIHGGVKGFDKVVWNVAEAIVEENGAISLKLTYTSADMEEGYPGKLETIVTYTLTNDDELQVLYEATTDKKTIVNLTQHSYFNLSGEFTKNILDHVVMIDAEEYTPVGDGLIPTGELLPVEGTPFDFRIAKVVGKEIAADHDQIKRGGGYDHNWVLNNQDTGIRLVASAYHPESGRLMEVFSTEPGVQVYTSNYMNNTIPAKNGGTYGKMGGICFETQHYPDSPNQPNFPSTELSPGEKYSTTTSFKFSTK